MARGRSRTFGEFDHATLRQAFAAPGMDPRQWCSMGIVDVDEGSQRAVRYDSPDNGLLVHVVLQPSGIPVVCRVASTCAGSGEADIEPFSAGDEVIVAVPEGDERSGPVILGRLNNALSPMPMRIAGMDLGNNVSGVRRLAPYVIESNTAIIFNVASTESFLALSQDGNITATSGDKSFLHIGADFLGFQTGDSAMVFQANQNTHEWRLDSTTDDHSTLTRFGGAQPGIMSTDPFFIGTNGQGPWQHLVTFEQLCAILTALLSVLILPVSGAATTPLIPPADAAMVFTALQAVLPLGLPLEPSILAGLLALNSKQDMDSGTTGLATGIIAS